jgi:lipopolysaccharide transport system permease protein
MRPITIIEPPSLAGVHPVRALVRLRQFSDLLWTLTLHRIKVRYQHTYLGYMWAVVQPLALMLVFALMFSVLGRTPAGEVPYALFAYAALVPWSAFSSGLSSASASITSHASLLTKVYFPREILPLTYVGAALVDAAAASVPLLALMLWNGVAPTPALWWTLPSLVLLGVFLTGIGLLLSAVSVRYRDVATAIPVMVQVWMFATPVLYPLTLVQHALSPGLYALYTLNPLVAVVDTFRRAVLGQAPDMAALAAGAIVSFTLLPVAYLYFKRQELLMADVV